MLFKNGMVLTGNFTFHRLDVRVENGIIAEMGHGLSGGDEVDITDKYLLPGLIDEHLHGGGGYSVRDLSEESLAKIAEFEATNGVTSIVPTLSSYPKDITLKAIGCTKKAMGRQGGADILGMHLEGPFLCEKYRGAHETQYLRQPDSELLKEYCKAADGIIRLITIAPELKRACEVIATAKENGITVGIGHSNATAAEAAAAIKAGATVAIHTFNAMRPLHHRNEGILEEVLTNDAVHCEVIGDFGHVSSGIVKLIFKCKGENRVNFVSDSIAAAGLPDGEYTAEEHTCTVKNGISYFENGTINGSASTILRGVKNAVSIGIPLESAIKAASHNPAVSLGVDGERGSIAPGKRADIFIADKELNVRKTYVFGHLCYGQGDRL